MGQFCPIHSLQSLAQMFVFRIRFDPSLQNIFNVSLNSLKSQEATSERFVGANGITSNRDASLVFVNDPLEKRITVLGRDPGSGLLTKQGEIKLPVGADNIEFDDQV